VVTVSWIEPARRLADDSARGGLAGLWSLLFAARRAVLALALLPGLDDDLAFTEAALDLRGGRRGAAVGARRPAAARRGGGRLG
jgi:hypothetical protein